MKKAPRAIRIGLGFVLLQGEDAALAQTVRPQPAPRDQVAAAAATPAQPVSAPTLASAAPVASAPVVGDAVVASIGNRSITMNELLQPLVEAHGLTVLLNLVQLDLAKDLAQQQGVTATDADFAAERKRTLDGLFEKGDERVQEKIDDAVRNNQPEEAKRLREELARDHEQLFDQFLQREKVTKAEFDLGLKTNAYLRKVVEPKADAAITDKELKQAFDIDYGASVRVRHIQANSAADLGAALARIRNGEPFEKVAREMSKNPRTAGLGGELPRFSLAEAGLPANFKEAAFALQVGEVSNIVEAEGAFHLIKLEEKFAPKAVKFENVKESVRQNLKERTVKALVGQARNQLGERARTELKITEPVMAGQFAARLADRDKQIQEEMAARQQQRRGTSPASRPAPLPEERIKPNIVVPIPPRTGAPAAAPNAANEPARAPEPPQGTPTAPANK